MAVAGKVWDEQRRWWRVWGEDLSGRRWLGEYLDAGEARAVVRRVERLGVAEAARVWDALWLERMLQNPVTFYYPIAEAQSGEAFQHGVWMLRCVERFDGHDYWSARCRHCGKEKTVTSEVPPKGALWPFRVDLAACDHRPARAAPSFLDDYPPEMRDELAQRFDP